MKRLLLIALLGLTFVQQICANETFNRALQTVGTQLLAAKNKFDNSSLIAQATVPALAGLAVGLPLAVCKNAINTYHYSHIEDPTSLVKYRPFPFDVKSAKIATSLKESVIYGAWLSYKGDRNNNPSQWVTGGTRLFSALNIAWGTSIICFSVAGAVYSLFKNNISDGLKASTGSLLTGFAGIILVDSLFNRIGCTF